MLRAPQTMRYAFSPARTRHRESRSAWGWGSTAMISPTTPPSKASPTSSMPSTSRPAMVSRSASLAGESSQSTYSRNQLQLTFMGLKLPQKTQVILEKKTKTGDAVLQHGNAFDTHAEGKPRHRVRVIADDTEDLGIDHPRTEYLQPAGPPADTAPFPVTDNAADIRLGARLGKGEKTGAEGKRRFCAKNLTDEKVQ